MKSHWYFDHFEILKSKLLIFRWTYDKNESDASLAIQKILKFQRYFDHFGILISKMLICRWTYDKNESDASLVIQNVFKFRRRFDHFEMLKSTILIFRLTCDKNRASHRRRQTSVMKFQSTCTLYKPTRTLCSCVTVKEKITTFLKVEELKKTLSKSVRFRTSGSTFFLVLEHRIPIWLLFGSVGKHGNTKNMDISVGVLQLLKVT